MRRKRWSKARVLHWQRECVRIKSILDFLCHCVFYIVVILHSNSWKADILYNISSFLLPLCSLFLLLSLPLSKHMYTQTQTPNTTIYKNSDYFHRKLWILRQCTLLGLTCFLAKQGDAWCKLNSLMNNFSGHLSQLERFCPHNCF